jgi:hypothetical protein
MGVSLRTVACRHCRSERGGISTYRDMLRLQERACGYLHVPWRAAIAGASVWVSPRTVASQQQIRTELPTDCSRGFDHSYTILYSGNNGIRWIHGRWKY